MPMSGHANQAIEPGTRNKRNQIEDTPCNRFAKFNHVHLSVTNDTQQVCTIKFQPIIFIFHLCAQKSKTGRNEDNGFAMPLFYIFLFFVRN